MCGIEIQNAPNLEDMRLTIRVEGSGFKPAKFRALATVWSSGFWAVTLALILYIE